MRVRLNIKRKSGKFSTVRAIVRINGKKYTASTGITVEVADWDAKRERCKNNPETNAQLEKARTEIQQHITKTGLPPPKKNQTQKTEQTITEAIQEHLRKKQTESTSTHTWRAYTTLIQNLNRYTTETGRKEKYLTDINSKYLEGFVAWMIQQYTNGHTSKMIGTLKAVIRRKIAPEKWQETKAPPPRPADQIYLTTDEIQTIENYQAKPGSMLDKTRDVFLAGYYTALRFSDWKQISNARVQTMNGRQVLQITQQKTKNPTTLPLSDKLRTIIEKYPNGLPVTSNQRFNKALKILMRTAGITQIIEITEHRGGKTVSLKFEKWELVSSHTARRSFATNAMLAGIPLTEVMKFTGHKSLQAFLQYIRTTGQDAAIKYADHPFFK